MMMAASSSPKQPTVFISYAHESEALRASVKALAEWLANHGCAVLTDHAYAYRPPEVGWQAWMHGCIDKAETVLVVCTLKLKLRYEKNEEPETGRGATYEGAIVTQHLYDNAMRNTKFFPVLPDVGGREADIPTTLKGWWNGHRFPSGNDGILRMIFNEPAAMGSPTASRADSTQCDLSPWVINQAHEEKTTELLHGEPVFFANLQREFPRYFKVEPNPQTESAMVRFFARCEAGQVQSLFYLVRRALLVKMEKDARRIATGHSGNEAAAYLYCLAACRLVDQAEHQARVSELGVDRYIVSVPTDENVVCAIIATALFGGELRLVPDKSGWPRAECVFEVEGLQGSDRIGSDFEFAAYVAVFKNEEEAPEMSLDRGSDRVLTHQQRKRLKARIGDFKNVQFSSLAFLVRALKPTEARSFASAIQGFMKTYEAPVLVPETEVTSRLLGMDIGDLLGEIQEFWSRTMGSSRLAAVPAGMPSPSPAAGPAMSPSGPVFNIGNLSGGLAFTAGSHSAAQSGKGHTARIDHRQGADPTELLPVLRELAKEIGTLTSPKARDALTAQVQIAEGEAAKSEMADHSQIKRALDAIKSGAEVLDNGGKIIDLCNKAYSVTAPLLGLPPSPVP